MGVKAKMVLEWHDRNVAAGHTPKLRQHPDSVSHGGTPQDHSPAQPAPSTHADDAFPVADGERTQKP